MRAVLSVVTGGPETLVLIDLAAPDAGPGEVVVAVRACAINFPDVLLIRDLYQLRPERPFAPGGEIAGEVVAVGPDVTDLCVGDRIVSRPGYGGLAERMVLPASACLPMPPGLTFDEASALPITFGTSYHALTQRGNLKAGETLLVLGAAGGVGIAAVQIGKALGARVVAAVSSEEKAAFARTHGADACVVYPPGLQDRDMARALTAHFRDACGPDGADVIYDAVGGPYSEAAFRAIAWGGRFLIIGFPAGIAQLPLNLSLLKGAQVVGVLYGSFARREPEVDRGNWAALLGLVAQGSLKPVVSQRFPLARAAAAIEELAERRAMGKIVVTIGP
jgi:NADPH:quinone reductase